MVIKKAKSEVDYSKGKPYSHCGICRYFIEGKVTHNFTPPVSLGTCQKVSGIISPNMWCKLFKKVSK